MDVAKPAPAAQDPQPGHLGVKPGSVLLIGLPNFVLGNDLNPLCLYFLICKMGCLMQLCPQNQRGMWVLTSCTTVTQLPGCGREPWDRTETRKAMRE